MTTKAERDIISRDLEENRFDSTNTCNTFSSDTSKQRFIYEVFKLEYTERSKNVSLFKFIASKLNTPYLTVRKILDYACDKINYKNNLVSNEYQEANDELRFSQNKTLISHKRTNIDKIAQNTVSAFLTSYPEFPVDYVTEATKEVVLYCSNEKIKSTLECPFYNYRFLEAAILAWFDQLFYHEENEIFEDDALVYYS